jgi:hypothetical protein
LGRALLDRREGARVPDVALQGVRAVGARAGDAVIRLVISRKTLSQNAFNNRRGFAGSMAYKNDRQDWMAHLRAQLSPKERPDHKVRLVVTSYRNRLLDYGNLVGGCKAIPDCLIRLGYLHDDAPKWLDCEYRQTQVPRGAERTVIVIDEPSTTERPCSAS